MQPVSFVICNYNALEYFRFCYQSIRDNLWEGHEVVLLDDGSTDESVQWMRSLHDPNLVRIELEENVGIAHAYNRAVEAAGNELVCVLHSDMYVPPGFDAAMVRGMERHDFIAAYRAEPALHPPSRDKAVADFGATLDTFDEAGFLAWNERNARERAHAVQDTLFFPWMTTRTLFCELGGVDLNYLKYMVDDDDLYMRVALAGARYGQVQGAAVYHFGSRSTRFADETFTERPEDAWAAQYARSQRNFVRKWGVVSTRCWDADMRIIPPRTWTIELVAPGLDARGLHLLEPFCSRILVSDPALRAAYVRAEQGKTLMDMGTRVALLSDGPGEAQVTARIDPAAWAADPERVAALVQGLPDVLARLPGPGTYDLAGVLRLTVRTLASVESGLVVNTRRFAYRRGMAEREFARRGEFRDPSGPAATGSRIPPLAAAATTRPAR